MTTSINPEISNFQPPTKLYTVAEACRILSIGKTLFYELVKAGQLETISITPRSVRVRGDVLQGFILSRPRTNELEEVA